MEEQIAARPDQNSDLDDDDDGGDDGDDDNYDYKNNDDTTIPKMKRRPAHRIVKLDRQDKHHSGSLRPGTRAKK